MQFCRVTGGPALLRYEKQGLLLREGLDKERGIGALCRTGIGGDGAVLHEVKLLPALTAAHSLTRGIDITGIGAAAVRDFCNRAQDFSTVIIAIP